MAPSVFRDASRYSGLATRTRLTEPRRIAIKLLSTRSPTRTATSTDSSVRWALRSDSDKWTVRPGCLVKTRAMIGNRCSRPNRMGAATFSDPAGLGVLAPDAALGPLDVLQHLPAAIQEDLATLGQTDRARGAIEKDEPQPVLQVGDRAGDDGGRKPQMPRRLREAAQGGDGNERAHGLESIHALLRNRQ